MRKIFLYLLFLLQILSIFAQNDWSKGDRGNAYEECMAAVKNRDGLNEDQQKSICLCYINEITQRYSKKDWMNKIEVEIERIQEGTIINCAKNIGIDLNNFQMEGTPPPVLQNAGASIIQKKENPASNPTENTSPIAISKEKMVGHWRSSNCAYWLLQNGNLLIEWDRGGKTKGRWTLEDNIFTCTYNFTKIIYKIEYFSANAMVYKALNATKETYSAQRME